MVTLSLCLKCIMHNVLVNTDPILLFVEEKKKLKLTSLPVYKRLQKSYPATTSSYFDI